MDTPDTIHAFWFGPAAGTDDDTDIVSRQSALWWKKQPEVDAEIRLRFAPLVARAAVGELDDWLSGASGVRGSLALILLTDQFPRNIWRGQAAAFAFDVLALRWTKEVLARGLEGELRPIERVFLYLPLEHSENLADQRESVRLFDALAAAVEPALRAASTATRARSSACSCTCRSSIPKTSPISAKRCACSTRSAARWPPRHDPPSPATSTSPAATSRSSSASGAFRIATPRSGARRAPRKPNSCVSPARGSEHVIPANGGTAFAR